MKRVVFPLACALLGLLLLAGCNNQPESSFKVGVVDEAAAFQKNKAAEQAMDYLKKVGEPLQKKAEAAYKTMQADQTEDNVAAYKGAMAELQQVMNGEQQRVIGMINAKFTEILENYRKEKGLTVILSKESVISSDEAVDITADITAAMDEVVLDLTVPAPAEEAPAEAAAEAPAEEAPAAE